MEFPKIPFDSKTAKITFLHKKETKEYPFPVNVSQLLPELQQEGRILVAAKVEGAIKNLRFSITHHTASIEPVYLDSVDGLSIYRRTISFILMMAASLEFKEKYLVTIEHPTSKNGYMVWLDEHKTQATEEQAKKLKERMLEIMKKDFPISSIKLSRAEALEYFSHRNRPFSVAYLDATNVTDLRCNYCEGYMDLYFRDLASSTGFHPVFDLIYHNGGFALLFCSGSDINKVEPFTPTPVLDQVYKECKRTARLINVRCVGDLNHKSEYGKSTEMIAVSEAIHQKRIVSCANAIAERTQTKIVLIAGPSSSGKTTFANKLALQLRVNGVIPIVISVDNYYRPTKEVPLGPDGKPDFECPEALRLDRLNSDLVSIIAGKPTETPIYDFALGDEKKTQTITLPSNGVIIMEGIHCLNDMLTPGIPRENKFKIFIAPLTPINLDETNFISNVVNRLARRMIRDYRTRGCSARRTLEMWPSVRAGEDKYIFPFLDSADFVMNTSFEHEMAVLKPHVIPLLGTIKPDDEYFNTANEELWLLKNFQTIQEYYLPPDSLLREFVGHSLFDE